MAGTGRQRAGGDLLQDLVPTLYICDQPVKLTPRECAQILGQVSAVVAIDDLSARADQVNYLLEVLSNCSLVISSAQPVLDSSRKLDGLPEESALPLVAEGLGRPLTAEELIGVTALPATMGAAILKVLRGA